MRSVTAEDHSPGLEFKLLGPFEAHLDGVPVSLPAGRPRTLLAVLALRPRAVVGTTSLTRYLWPDEQPEHPRRTLQTYAARLRAVLGHNVVATATDGYILRCAVQQVDLFRFRSLVSAAEHVSIEPSERLDTLQEALAIWRGQPLDGLTPDLLHREYAPAFQEEFLGANERVNELRLQLNRLDDELVGSLRRLVAEHPWRERLWSQLMRALYCQGRQGEALAAFHELVGTLRDDLGIDPGRELTELHLRMLDGDPSLVPADEGTAGPEAAVAVPRPVQLPPDVTDFVGRADVRAQMINVLSGDSTRSRCVVVSGAAGTGKTALAVRAAHEAIDCFPDGQLIADLRGTTEPVGAHEILAAFLRALGVSGSAMPAMCDERSALFRSMCAERRLLVVLDNAHSTEQVVPLLPGSTGCAVVITSRRQLPATPSQLRIDLAALSMAEANHLLGAIVGDERLAAEPDATATVLDACGGLPLAVRIAGGRLVTRPSWPVAELATQLTEGSTLDVLALDGMSVRGALDVAYRGLQPELAARFQLLAVMPATTAEVDDVAAAWNVDREAARRSLEQLCDLRLLEPTDAETYQWHDLVQQYMGELADPDELTGPAARLLRRMHRILENAKRCLRSDQDPPSVPDDVEYVECREFGDRRDVHDWLHPRIEQIMLLLCRGLAGKHGVPVDEAAAAMMLLDLVVDECCMSGPFEDAACAVLDADVPLPAGMQSVGAAWHNVGSIRGDQHRFDEAFEAGERALAIWRELGDELREMALVNNMAYWHMLAGRLEAAVPLLTTCIEAEGVLPPQLRVRCLQNLADVYISLGRYDDAERSLTRAASLYVPDPESRDAFDEALSWGQLYRESGQWMRAREAYERAAGAGAALSSPLMRATALVGLATTERLRGADGTDPATRALEIARNGHVPRVEAEALVELGHCARSVGDDAVAGSYWHTAWRKLEHLGSADADQVRELLASG